MTILYMHVVIMCTDRLGTIFLTAEVLAFLKYQYPD